MRFARLILCLLGSVFSVLLLPSSAWSSPTTEPPVPTETVTVVAEPTETATVVMEPTETATVIVPGEPTDTATVVVTEQAEPTEGCGSASKPCAVQLHETAEQQDWLAAVGVAVITLCGVSLAALIGSWRR